MGKKALRRIIEAMVVLGVIIFFVLVNEQITEDRRSSFVIIPDSDLYAFQIEDILVEGEDLVVEGWFFELNKVRNVERKTDERKQIAVYMYNMNEKEEINIDGSAKAQKGIRMKVSNQNRKDINGYFDCEYDYSDCGFIAKINKNLIDLKNGFYQIIIKINEDSENGVLVGYCINGKLQYTSPLDKMELNVKGTDLEEIVENGVCVVSYPLKHICVYQYGWKLYWIVDKEYQFEEDSNTTIQYQMDTTQFDKLPDGRTAKGAYWSNMGFDFESYEKTGTINCGDYRVAERDLPKEYSITRIVTGYNSGGKWIWKRYFRPIYRYR